MKCGGFLENHWCTTALISVSVMSCQCHALCDAVVPGVSSVYGTSGTTTVLFSELQTMYLSVSRSV